MRNRLVPKWMTLTFLLRSYQCHVNHCVALHLTLNRPISETVRDRGLVPKGHQQAYGLSNGHVTDDVTWPQRCCEAVRSAILATAWLLIQIRGGSRGIACRQDILVFRKRRYTPCQVARCSSSSHEAWQCHHSSLLQQWPAKQTRM